MMDQQQSKQKKFYERYFGKQLIKCQQNDNQSTIDVLTRVQIIGVYFSFANVKNDEFVHKLRALYDRLNSNHCEIKTNDGCHGRNVQEKKFEIVQVVLWAHNDVVSDDFEQSHRDSLKGLPWYAMPYSEIELKTKLSRRFRIKSGVPTLCLLDRDGSTLSVSAQDRLLEDPLGLSFPWRPRPVEQVLKDVVLQRGGAFAKQKPENANSVASAASLGDKDVTYADLPEGVRGFYFSANWCPPCRAFTPQLVQMYKNVKLKKEHGFEIVFVSSDRSAESYAAYVETMPWYSIPWQQAGVRAELAQLYGIRGIPTLLLLDRNGHVITMDARTELAEDPRAQNFPWKPRSVNILTERFANKLHDSPAIVLFIEGEETELQFAESVLTAVADNSRCCHDDDYANLEFLIGLDSTETSEVLRDLIGLDDVTPLLVAIDMPNHRFAVMQYGVEITTETVTDFVDKFQNGNVDFIDIVAVATTTANDIDQQDDTCQK